MNDLISRQAAMAFPLSWEHRDKEHGSDEFISGVECYRDYIEGLPSAQQERKMGTWRICTEEIEETFHTGSRCTVCNYWKPMGIWKYCPNCGADMREEEND